MHWVNKLLNTSSRIDDKHVVCQLNFQGMVASDTTTSGWVWPIVFNQIVEFLAYQYLWEESIDILVFFHGVNPQRREAFEESTFGWVGPVVSLVWSVCMILLPSVSRERVNSCLSIFAWQVVIKEICHLRLPLFPSA